MVARNEIYRADLEPPGGRRPVRILTRSRVIAPRRSVTCAPITRRVRGIPAEVEVGPAEGLPHPGVINCDNVLTVSRGALDRAPRFALDIAF